MARTVLHIGINKTGTSALQVWLSTNRAALAECGVAYPDQFTEMHGHHPLSRRIGAARGDDVTVAKIRAEVEDARDGANLAVFSSEHFHTLVDLDALVRIFPPVETRVLLYVREPVGHIVSWYQQAVQSRATTVTLTEFAQLHHRSQSELLDRWVAAYGSNITVRLFDRVALTGHDIVTDFLGTVLPDLDPADFRAVGERNRSITGNLLFLKRLLNLFLTDAEAREVATETGAVARISPRWQGRLLVGAEEAAQLAALTAADRRALVARGIPLPPVPSSLDGRRSPEPERLAEDLRTLTHHLARKASRSLLAPHIGHVMALLTGADWGCPAPEALSNPARSARRIGADALERCLAGESRR